MDGDVSETNQSSRAPEPTTSTRSARREEEWCCRLPDHAQHVKERAEENTWVSTWTGELVEARKKKNSYKQRRVARDVTAAAPRSCETRLSTWTKHVDVNEVAAVSGGQRKERQVRTCSWQKEQPQRAKERTYRWQKRATAAGKRADLRLAKKGNRSGQTSGPTAGKKSNRSGQESGPTAGKKSNRSARTDKEDWLRQSDRKDPRSGRVAAKIQRGT